MARSGRAARRGASWAAERVWKISPVCARLAMHLAAPVAEIGGEAFHFQKLSVKPTECFRWRFYQLQSIFDEQRKRSAYGARQGKPFPRQTQVATKFGPVRSWKVNRCGWPGHKAVCFTSFRGDIMAILTLHWQHDKVQKPLRSWSCEARCCCPISL